MIADHRRHSLTKHYLRIFFLQVRKETKRRVNRLPQKFMVGRYLVGGGTFFIFPYIGSNHPNWLIFFRGVAQPPTSYIHYFLQTQQWNVGLPSIFKEKILRVDQISEIRIVSSMQKNSALIPSDVLNHLNNPIVWWVASDREAEPIWDHRDPLGSIGDPSARKKLQCSYKDPEMYKANFCAGWWWLVAMNLAFSQILGCCHHPNWRTHIFQRGS